MKILEFIVKQWRALIVRANSSLTYKFALFALIAVTLPAATIATSLIVIGRGALNEMIYAQQSETAGRIADRISMHITHVRSVLSIAASEPGLPVLSRSRQEFSLAGLLRWQPTFKEAWLINERGQELAKLSSKNNRFISSPALGSRAGHPEFQIPVAEGKTYISDPFFGSDHVPYIIVSVPTYRRRAVLAVKVTLENIWELVREVRAGHPGLAYIVDQSGTLIAHPDADRVLMQTTLKNLSIVQAFQNRRLGKDSFGLHENEKGEKVVSLVQDVPQLKLGVVMETPTESAYAPIRAMEKQVIGWTIISVCVILSLALVRMRQITKPIELLQAGANSIAHGKLDLGLDIHTGDELEQLAKSFENMAKSLKESEEMRRDLINMIVHDLKSPLSGIMGGLDYALEMGAKGNEETKRTILGLARKASEDLLSMIQNLLDVAKMEEGKLELKKERVIVPDLLNDCAAPFMLQMEKESKQLSKEFAPDLPPVSLDIQLIRRVVTNLLSNAIRHSSSSGRIDLKAMVLGTNLEIIVEDDGDGIPSEYLTKIFDKFVQAERKRAHVRSGTGLGLTFCKMAVELHGGVISVKSDPGQGSAFCVSLPLREVRLNAGVGVHFDIPIMI